jgi:hypothetical protein
VKISPKAFKKLDLALRNGINIKKTGKLQKHSMFECILKTFYGKSIGSSKMNSS